LASTARTAKIKKKKNWIVKRR